MNLISTLRFSNRPRWAPDELTVISALLIILVFPVWNLWPLIWICLIPWFAAVRRAKTSQEACIQGVWLSFIVSNGSFFWVASVLTEFGGLPWILSIVGLQLFSLVGQPQFILFGLLRYRLESTRRSWNPILSALLFALAYAGMDWILPKLFVDTLGHGFYLARHLRQIADIGGPPLLTFLAYLVNEAIWEQLQIGLKSKKWIPIPSLILALSFALICWTYGYIRAGSIQTQTAQAPKSVQIAAIQGNIGDFDKLAAEQGARDAAYKIVQTFTEMTDSALLLNPRPDIIVWPETAYPSTFRNPHTFSEIDLDRTIEGYVKTIGVPLLFGGYDRIGRKDFNAFFFLYPSGQLQTYHKNILLLFGEYIPGSENMDWIKNTFPQVGNFGRGIGPDVIPIETFNPKVGVVHAGPIICYEALFTNYVADAARKGSQFILNITNDSWFGEWGEPQLHLALTIFRSIETRLPQLRSTNTGISALITADGEITHATGIGVRQLMNVSVPLTPPIPTLIKRWGDWFGPSAFILGMGGILTLVYRKRKTRAQTK